MSFWMYAGADPLTAWYVLNTFDASYNRHLVDVDEQVGDVGLSGDVEYQTSHSLYMLEDIVVKNGKWLAFI